MTINRIRNALVLAGAVLAASIMSGCAARIGAEGGVLKRTQSEVEAEARAKAEAGRPPSDADVYAAKERALAAMKAQGLQNLTIEVLDQALEPIEGVRLRAIDEDFNTYPTEPTGKDGRTSLVLPTLAVRWEQLEGTTWQSTAPKRYVEQKTGGLRAVFSSAPDRRPRGTNRGGLAPPASEPIETVAAAPPGNPLDGISFPPEAVTVKQRRVWLENQADAAAARKDFDTAIRFAAAHEALATD